VTYDFLIRRDADTGNWWVQLDDEWVGYFPGSLFTALDGSADSITMGGRVLNSARLPTAPPGQTHTRTQMGSGRDGMEMDRTTTAYHTDLQNIDEHGEIEYLGWASFSLNDNLARYDPTCYNGKISYFDEKVAGIVMPKTYYFYGGSGVSPFCF
jgi:hypothetical protein